MAAWIGDEQERYDREGAWNWAAFGVIVVTLAVLIGWGVWAGNH